MRAEIAIFSIAIVLAHVTEGWLTSYGHRRTYRLWGGPPGGYWAPDCIQTEGECIQSSQCCGEHDVCLADRKTLLQTGRTKATCKDMSQYKYGGTDLKFEGEPCVSSDECITLCCRMVRRHIYGTTKECGAKDGFLCT